jgi:branched-chain amino acid transport system ATP-binding protein/urea transport system ATP-binding protein
MPEPPRNAQGLALAGVVAGYGEGTELHGVDLQVLPGERVGLLGRNGAGKTTLLRTVMGLTRVAQGAMSFAGQDLRRMPTFAVARLGLACVPQGRELFADFTVEQNLLTGLLGLQGSRSGPRDLSVALRAFPFLAGRLQERAGALSGGQQQQLAIGRAIVSHPALLMLDEPLEGVQPSVVNEIVQALDALCEATGMGLLLVEQNVDVVLRLCSRVAFMEAGVVRETLPSAAVRDDPGLVERYLGI